MSPQPRRLVLEAIAGSTAPPTDGDVCGVLVEYHVAIAVDKMSSVQDEGERGSQELLSEDSQRAPPDARHSVTRLGNRGLG